MRVILSAAGRAFLRDGLIAFLALAVGIWQAPDQQQALAIAGAATLALLVAGVRAIRVFIPGFSTALTKALHVPVAYAEVVITGITTVLVGFVAFVEGVESLPNLDAARAAGLAAMLGIGTSLTRLVQAFLTPGETPAPAAGITVPEQPVPAPALPTPMPSVFAPEGP